MLKRIILLCNLLMLVFACTNRSNPNPGSGQSAGAESVYLLAGTYTSGSSDGIYVYRFNTESGDMEYVSDVKGIANPSYLVVSADKKFVYSVGESTGNNAVAYAFSFDKNTGTLKLLNSQPTKGDDPCYINTDKGHNFVLTANYTGGNISVFPIAQDGSLQPASQILTFSPGISHLHTVVFSPDGKYLFATDLGTDHIYKFEVNEAAGDGQFLQQDESSSRQLETGSGPRHLAFHPNNRFVYCINELSGKVAVLQYASGVLTAVQYIASDTTSGYGGKGSGDIHISPDGRFLYTSNRLKADGIAIFSINENDGTLKKTAYQPTGTHPRNFIISPDGKYMLVANRDSNNIQLFAIDKETGLLKDTGKEQQLDKPVCLKIIE